MGLEEEEVVVVEVVDGRVVELEVAEGDGEVLMGREFFGFSTTNKNDY